MIEGLAKLDKVLCAVLLNAANLIVDGAAEFIPGGAEINAIIKSTKKIAKAGAKASSYFGDWIGPACGLADFPTLTWDSIFTNMVGLPDDYGLPGGAGPKPGKPPAKAASKPTTKATAVVKSTPKATTKAATKPTNKATTVVKSTPKATTKATAKPTNKATNKAATVVKSKSKSTTAPAKTGKPKI